MMSIKKVEKLPGCNFCSEPAHYDAPMRGSGSWAYFCCNCFAERGSHSTFTKFELMTEDEAEYSAAGAEEYDAELEQEYLKGLDMEELMKESLFGDSAGV